MFAIDPEERQSERPTWLPILLSVCEAELEDVGGDEREQQTRRQLLILGPLQTKEKISWGNG